MIQIGISEMAGRQLVAVGASSRYRSGLELASAVGVKPNRTWTIGERFGVASAPAATNGFSVFREGPPTFEPLEWLEELLELFSKDTLREVRSSVADFEFEAVLVVSLAPVPAFFLSPKLVGCLAELELPLRVQIRMDGET